MKRKMICVLILLVLILISAYQVEAAMNKEELLDYLSEFKGLGYDLRDYTDDFKEDRDENFSEKFYQDFFAGNIEFIEPEHRTNDMADIEWLNYLRRYPDFCLRRNSKLQDPKIPHYNFRYYQIDFTGNGKVDDIFYSDGYRNNKTVGSRNAQYDILSKHTKIDNYDEYKDNPWEHISEYWMGRSLVKPEYKGRNKEETGHFNGIIKYEDIYYIYEVLVRSTLTRIKFYRWNEKLEKPSTKILTELRYTIIQEEDK